jgi:acylphosphatase
MTDVAESICLVTIRGQVQRVGFRNWVEYTAGQHGLSGWVRNRRDGTVEALFAGRNAEVGAMIEACRRGPSSARVEAVEPREATSRELSLRQPGETFSVLPTI